MNRLTKLIAVILFFSASHLTYAQSVLLPGQQNCQFNCAQLRLVGSSLVATLFDRTGVPIKVVAHEVGAGARVVTSAPPSIRNGQVTAMNTWTTSTVQMETATHWVYVTTVTIYADNGSILDIKITEVRVPKDKRQEK